MNKLRKFVSFTAAVWLLATSAAQAQFPNRFFAPYADVLLFPTINLTTAPVNHFVLAFIIDDFVSPGSNTACRGAWGGVVPLTENHMADQIAQIRARGGDVMISFGGVAGTELAVAPECNTVARLQAAYQEVIDRYDVNVIDMDIEGAAILDQAANDRRAKALRGLQQANPGLQVWFTIPAAPSGLIASGVSLIQNAAQNNVDFNLNTMSFDFGPFDRGDPRDLGPTIIRSMDGSISQLANALNTSEAQAAARYSVTVMVGVNDVRPETLLQQGAQEVLAHARQRNIKRLSIWSLNRDNGNCPGKEFADPTCSGLSQADFAFTNILRAFTGGGGNPPPPPPPPPSAPAAPSNLSAAANGTSVVLTWNDNSQGEDFFQIQRSSGGGFTNVGQVGRGVETFSDAPGNGTFTYRVRASRNGILSGFSNTASATIGGGGGPAAPSNLAAIVNGNTVSLSWNDNSQGEDFFEIQRSAGGGFSNIGQVGRGVRSFSDTPGNGPFFYRVRASRGGIPSAFSNTANAIVGDGNPDPNPNPDPGTWAAGVAYGIGDEVTFGGTSFRCRQAHTSQVGWEPPNVLALWLPL